ALKLGTTVQPVPRDLEGVRALKVEDVAFFQRVLHALDRAAFPEAIDRVVARVVWRIHGCSFELEAFEGPSQIRSITDLSPLSLISSMANVATRQMNTSAAICSAMTP